MAALAARHGVVGGVEPPRSPMHGAGHDLLVGGDVLPLAEHPKRERPLHTHEPLLVGFAREPGQALLDRQVDVDGDQWLVLGLVFSVLIGEVPTGESTLESEGRLEAHPLFLETDHDHRSHPWSLVGGHALRDLIHQRVGLEVARERSKLCVGCMVDRVNRPPVDGDWLDAPNPAIAQRQELGVGEVEVSRREPGVPVLKRIEAGRGVSSLVVHGDARPGTRRKVAKARHVEHDVLADGAEAQHKQMQGNPRSAPGADPTRTLGPGRGSSRGRRALPLEKGSSIRGSP